MRHQFKLLMKNMVIVRLLAILQVLPEHTLQLLEADDPIACSKPSEDRLLSALRRLVSDRKDDDEWDPAKGPSKGIRWRGGTPPQAPTWSYDKEDLRAYNKYVRKVEIWLLQVAPYMTRKEAALQLYGALAGEPEAELEHCPITDIYQDDGVERILEAVKAPMEQKQVYHDHEALGARLLDRSGLSHEQQRLLLVSTSQNLAFDQLAEAMALQFPDFRGAPPIVGANGREIPKGNSKGGKTNPGQNTTSPSSSSTRTSSSSTHSGKGYPKKAYVAEVETPAAPEDSNDHLDTIDEDDEPPDQEDDQEPDDSVHDTEAESVDLSELAQVLTITAKKLSGLTLGHKWSKTKPGSQSSTRDRRSPEDAKRNTHCSACGQRGHWYQDPECPKNQGKTSSSATSYASSKKSAAPSSSGSSNKPKFAVNLIHHEHGSISIGSHDHTNMAKHFQLVWFTTWIPMTC